MSDFEPDDESRITDFIKEASLSMDERALAAFVRGMLARRKAAAATPSEDSSRLFTNGTTSDWSDASPFI